MADLSEPLVPSRSEPSEPMASILLVDDNPANLLSLRAILEDLDQNLVDARSGEDALRRARDEEFAVVLLDVLMPGIGGFETAKRLRADERSGHTPIIFLTASDIDRSQTEEAYALGAVDFLGKPLMPVALRAKVRGLVELYQDKQRARREADQFRLLVQGATDYAIFLLDPQGHVASWNLGAERIKGYAADDIIGRHFSTFYPQEALDRGWPEHELKVSAAEGRFEDEGWRLRKDGSRFWANVVITALKDERGNLLGFSKITRDLTARRQAEESARRLAEEAAARQAAHDERERLRVTLASIGDAVISTDAQGRVNFLNLVAEELVGWKSGEAAGQTLEDVFRIVNENTRQPVENPALRALKEGKVVGLANQTVLISKDGAERPIDDSAAPIRDAGGEVVGSVLVFRDISERKRSEAALGERMRLLALNAAVGEALVRGDGLEAMLRCCAGALVEKLHGAFARIWTLNEAGDVLELRASAGLYTHLDGPHSRVPVGQYKIGLIAQERKPHLTNAVVGDPRVGDQEWARREGMVAFAGYPLLVADRLVGVMAMFSRQPLSEATLEAMASVANGIATGIERQRAQDRLAEQREWLRVTLASIGDAVITTDTQGRVTFLNAVAQELTGWPQGEAQGRPLEDVFPICHEQTRQPVENPVAKVLKEGRAVGLANHTVLLRRDGTDRPIDDSAAPIRAADGGTVGVVLVFRDVTEQRGAEREVRRSEARKGAILETALDCIITCDQHGNVLEFNPAAERTFGYRRAEVVGRDMADLIIPATLRERHRRGMARYLATGEGPVLGRRIEIQARRADGTEFPVELAITRIAVDGPPQFTAYLRDISERVRAEARRNARLVVTQVLAQAVTVPEAAGGVLRAVCESLGWDVGFFWTLGGQVEALRCLESWHRPDVPATEFEATSRRCMFARGEGLPGHVWATGRPHWTLDVVHDANFPRVAPAARDGLHGAFACPIVLGGDTLGVIEFFSRQVREPDADLLEMMGTVAGQIGQFMERKEAEDRLRQSERELADFFENATEGFHWVGLDGTILRANRAELDLLGYAAEEYVGHKITEFHADPDVIADILRRLQAGEELHNYEARLRCKDGSLKHVLINSNVLRRDGEFAHTRCFTRDVTERKRNEAVLAGQKRVLELLVQGAPLPDVLDTLCEIIEGRSQQNLIATILLMDEDGQRLRSVAGRRAPAAYARAVDGVPVGPSVGSCGTAAYRGEPVIATDIATDPLWADFRDLALGHGLRACWSTPIFSSQGKVLGTFAVYYPTPRHPSPEERKLVDILTRTAGVAVERRQAEEALKEADRRKDEFLATLAHELRNPLAPMRNALQVMQLAAGDGAAVGQAREMMERQMRHMVRLVDDLLDVSRITRGKLELRKQRVELAAVVRTAVETSRPLIEAGDHVLTVALPPQPLFVDGDPVRLAQVFSNLLNNAAKYTDRGGRIWITAERHGSDAVVSVRDSGLGIPREMLAKVFELFTQVDRTLEKAQGGLGIGLTLVRRLTEMHGGSVEAHSEGYGHGSEFTVRLPAILVAPACDEGATEESAPSSRRRLLVVDDNRDSAISLGMMLQLMGNDVRTAHDGLEAVQAAGAFRPDVVLLDIGLPKLNGYEAARRIREQPWGRDMVLIAVTGWGQEEDKRRSKEAGFNFHMVKPVEPAALEKLLAGLLSPR